MLKRILSNLIDNALKAARSYVGISLSSDGTNWVFTICDDGAGVGQADINRIFDPYISLDKKQPGETGGYGLGLYVALLHGYEFK
ncbi:MAG: ATP-binding protein [Rhizobiales bacterium]|nr:ATP-binding protein [Hyphomicrobiales bacterium]